MYVYFDNDAKVHAPFDAMSLAARLGVGPAPGAGVRRPPAGAGEEARPGWPAFARPGGTRSTPVRAARN